MIAKTVFTTVSLTAVAALSLAAVQYAEACTRIFANDKGDPMLVARSMDWATTTEPVLTVFPRGLARDGGNAGPMTVVTDNPAKWTSQYGSVVTTIFGIGTADGDQRARPRRAHALFPAGRLRPARRGQARRPGRPVGAIALDNAATVEEALAKLATVQIVKVEIEVHGQKQTGTVHVALEDASGDSAILEYLGGKLVVHHGREFRVMTNAPEYDKQLELLGGKDFANPTMETQVPGNVNPRDRFQRATYFLSVLTKPTSERAGVAGMFGLIRNVSIPFGAPVNGSTFDTEYRTVSNLTGKRYFFELTTAPNVIWTDLSKLNFSEGAPVHDAQPQQHRSQRRRHVAVPAGEGAVLEETRFPDMAGLVPAIGVFYGYRPGLRGPRGEARASGGDAASRRAATEPRTRRRRGLGFRQPIEDDDVKEHEARHQKARNEEPRQSGHQGAGRRTGKDLKRARGG